MGKRKTKILDPEKLQSAERIIQDMEQKENEVTKLREQIDNMKKEIPAMMSWKALEYEHVVKSKDWYWAVAILTAALMIVVILLKNFLFASFIMLAGFVIALYGAKRPRVVKFSINAGGLQIADKLYPYDSLKSLWIRIHILTKMPKLQLQQNKQSNLE